MDTPPPLPTHRPIRRAEFIKQLKFRLGDVSLDYPMIKKSHDQAEAWINANPGIDIVNIQTFHGNTSAITVVWYR